jgi:hypothetical protein
MAFFNVDDQFHGHPKAQEAYSALPLWTLAGSWCKAYKSNGQVPLWWVVTKPNGRRHAGMLARAGLWHAPGHDCPECPQPTDPKGWIFHDWLDINDSADQIEQQRDQWRARQRKRRAKLQELRSQEEA